MAPSTAAALLTGLLSLGLGVCIGRVLRRKRGAPPDPISSSGRLIAAWRALESVEPRPLFVDPFAAALAGSDAVHQALQLAQPFPQPAGAAAAAAAGEDAAAAGEGPASSRAPAQRRYRFSNVAARVCWFDQQLAAALAAPAARPGQQPRQVVVLGAGYDSRPWRLRLPPGVRWFELDLPQVAAAKRELLQQLGAGLEASQPAAHPLRAASWAGLAGDLCQPGWSAQLVAAGLDRRRPTVWVLEGLLMYLTPKQATVLLQEMAGMSPAGSCIILHQSTTDLVELIGQGAATYAPFPPELVATWHSKFPAADRRPALAALLRAAGWPRLREVTSRARIAAHIVASHGIGGGGGGGGSGGGEASAAEPTPEEVAVQCDFETSVDEGQDRWAVFVVAGK